MERKRQREIVLAVVAVLAILLVVYRIRSMSPASSAADGSPAAVMAKRQAGPGVTPVELDALKAPRPAPESATRNPFRFKPKPLPPAPPMPTRPAVPIQTGPVEPPPPPRIPLKFIGVVESGATGRVAVLRDDRGVYRGRVGDTIEGRYRILQIGVESIELAYVDGRGRQTIRQTGQ
jgi:hypothetical protein